MSFGIERGDYRIACGGYTVRTERSDYTVRIERSER